MNSKHLILSALLLSSVGIKAQVEAPAPIAPLPEARQVAWQKMETYAFIHFGPNTFGDREWGFGDADPKSFNPAKLDCEQWARILKKGGMKGVIITAKHHDGFCLWPTMYTDYSVRNSPYKDGKGDIVGELATACRKYGLKFGVYLSPWDRHQGFYATPIYREYFHAQLHELLTKYGDLFEVWFDGANGGDGWYGGAKETRKIDANTYYDFPRAWAAVDSLQPNAVIFSDDGPGCRWVGNERGFAMATNWSFITPFSMPSGAAKHFMLQQGQPDGTKWIPAECDVSIRPGWFYHERENSKVKTPDQLVDLYYRNVGHNSTFLLNVPVDREGLIHPADSASLIDFSNRIAKEFAYNLLKGASVSVDGARGKAFGAKMLTDGNYDSYWATADDVVSGTIHINFKRPTKLNRMMLQEYIPLGQRVRSFVVEYLNGKTWQPVKMSEETTTIGYKRLLRFKEIAAKRMRVRILDARGPLCINEIGAYYVPGAKESFMEQDAVVESLPYTIEKKADEVMLDLGEVQPVKALFYVPSQANGNPGLIDKYEIYTGNTPDNLKKVAEGEFSNIRNNPIMQEVFFTPQRARYIRLKAVRMVREGESVAYENLAVQ
uniref:alpha-L-fucosidase n=1 Tax=Prevotella sp. GTC17262 TaxID=3236797 RepID=A0AB33JLB4_9BACT